MGVPASRSALMDDDLDGAFELAEGVLANPLPDPGLAGEGCDEAFEVAAGILAAVPPVAARPALGMPARSAATAAFARQCRATQIATAKVEKLGAKLNQFTERGRSARHLGGV